MRLKKVKGASEKIKNSPICYEIDDLEKNQKLFDNNNPVHLEIGIGKGRFLHTLAMQNPHINYVGVEMFDSVIVRALEKVENHPLPNIKFIRSDASKLSDIFTNYFSHIYLNFSDPWPKNRHEKRRLTSRNFLNVYKHILITDGIITFKTDNSQLFEYSVQSMNNYGCSILKFTIDLHESSYNEDNIYTEYEEKFSNKGFNIKLIEIQFLK